MEGEAKVGERMAEVVVVAKAVAVATRSSPRGVDEIKI